MHTRSRTRLNWLERLGFKRLNGTIKKTYVSCTQMMIKYLPHEIVISFCFFIFQSWYIIGMWFQKECEPIEISQFGVLSKCNQFRYWLPCQSSICNSLLKWTSDDVIYLRGIHKWRWPIFLILWPPSLPLCCLFTIK